VERFCNGVSIHIWRKLFKVQPSFFNMCGHHSLCSGGLGVVQVPEVYRRQAFAQRPTRMYCRFSLEIEVNKPCIRPSQWSGWIESFKRVVFQTGNLWDGPVCNAASVKNIGNGIPSLVPNKGDRISAGHLQEQVDAVSLAAKRQAVSQSVANVASHSERI